MLKDQTNGDGKRILEPIRCRFKAAGVSDEPIDNAPTKFSAIRITPGAGNDISDWMQAFTYARLEVTAGDGLGAVLTGTVDYNVFSANTSSIVFSAGTSDDNTDAGYIDDNEFKEYTLKIHLKPNMSGALNLPAIIDNLNFVFSAASGNVTLENSTGGQLSSQFAATTATTTSTSNAVSVAASQLLFDQPGLASSPTNPQSGIGVGIPFSATNGAGSTPNPLVYALDANHNLDLDYENANGNNGSVSNTLILGQNYTPSFTDGVLSLASFSFTEGNNSTPTQIVVTGTGSPAVTEFA